MGRYAGRGDDVAVAPFLGEQNLSIIGHKMDLPSSDEGDRTLSQVSGRCHLNTCFPVTSARIRERYMLQGWQ